MKFSSNGTSSISNTEICEALKKTYAELHASEIQHDSDCAMHNAPALPVGPCNCSAAQRPVE